MYIYITSILEHFNTRHAEGEGRRLLRRCKKFSKVSALAYLPYKVTLQSTFENFRLSAEWPPNMHVYIHAHTHTHTHSQTHIHTHKHTHMHTYMYICIHTHTHAHTHTHIHICIHTHTHTHTYELNGFQDVCMMRRVCVCVCVCMCVCVYVCPHL